MNRNTIIVTGGDAGFFDFILNAVSSLRDLPALNDINIGVIDQGLHENQVSMLARLGCDVKAAEWDPQIPSHLKVRSQIGLSARMHLRDYFPGYGIYLWFDADAWAQTPTFFDEFTSGARALGAAVAVEAGPGYRKTYRDRRWWAGNAVLSFGLTGGLKLATTTTVNIGVLAIRGDAPHWGKWRARYLDAVSRTEKLNVDQHAFQAATLIDNLSVASLRAEMNWLPHLSRPLWSSALKLFMSPSAPPTPISVLHLAGPMKKKKYTIGICEGGIARVSLERKSSNLLERMR